MAQAKARVLIVGSGGVGTMAAYALEKGGKADVTVVCRSNYAHMNTYGIDIDSVDHGHRIMHWRPTNILPEVPNVKYETLQPFDFILVTTKNCPDILPTISDVIKHAVTAGKTAIVLSQNGLNIEKQLIERFPTNPILSSVSYISTTITPSGKLIQSDADAQNIGAFDSPGVPRSVAEEAARRYVDIYNPAGKLDVIYDPDVKSARWHKLVYNAAFNPVAALMRIDTTRMRMSRFIIDDLIRPIMREVVAAARANGVQMADDITEIAIYVDRPYYFFKPSMCQDVEKGSFMEIETLVGEPLRQGEAKGVKMPMLRTVYSLLRGQQLRIAEEKGLWKPKWAPDNPYHSKM
ncbi:putative 2-dehydropantoate 2-reductase [Xylaria sp. FL0933]|nr:putative 2-dehydropantoate 2-reductase [Xylaria sp. FL0933]